MEKIVDAELLLKFVSGSSSLEESERVLEWIAESEENAAAYSRIKNYWVLERYKTFNTESVSSLAGVPPFQQDKLPRSIVNYKKILSIAATIALIITLSALILFSHKDSRDLIPGQSMAKFEYHVNSGVKGFVDLPDGSRVWLNSSSSLKCPQKFDSLERVVEIEGEGYFEVVPNKDWPMYVKTSKGYGVKVTGTSFNLSSYSNDNKLVVTLIAGSVSIVHEENKSEIKLKPDEQITIVEKELPKLTKKANVEYNTAWKKGYLLFDNTPMQEVIRKVERWYGVNVMVKDSSIMEYRFTANFRSESISQVLEILKLSSNIKYEIDKTDILLRNF